MTGCAKVDSGVPENPCNLVDCGPFKTCKEENGEAKCVEIPCKTDKDCYPGTCCEKKCRITPCSIVKCNALTTCVASGCSAGCRPRCIDSSDCGADACCNENLDTPYCQNVCVKTQCRNGETCQANKKDRCKAECVKNTPVCNLDCVKGLICEIINGKPKCVEKECKTDKTCKTDEVCCKSEQNPPKTVCQLTPCARVRCAYGPCIAIDCQAVCTCQHKKDCGPTECCIEKNSIKTCKDVCKHKHCKKHETCQAIKDHCHCCKAKCVKIQPVCNPDCKDGYRCEFINGKPKCVQKKCKTNKDCNDDERCCKKVCIPNPCKYSKCSLGFVCIVLGNCDANCEPKCEKNIDCNPTECCKKKNSISYCKNVCENVQCEKGRLCLAIKKSHERCEAECVCPLSCKKHYHCVIDKYGKASCIHD